MPDYRAVIENIIQEHQAIRRTIKLAGDSMSDRESLSALGQARADWVPGRLDIMVEKQKVLKHTLTVLAKGLENHFHFEESSLPPILGEFLMRALVLEHGEIKQAIAQARQVVDELSLEGLKPEQVLSAELRIQQSVNSTAHVIEEHAFREEVLLTMVQRGLAEQ